MERRAKIVATLGPASSDEEVIRELVRAGADIFRCNLSHGTHEEHAERLARVRRGAEREGRHVAVMGDLMGPRYPLRPPGGRGRREGEQVLAAGETVRLGGGPAAGGEGTCLPVDDPDFLRHLKDGERVLIDGGRVALRVEGPASGAAGAVGVRARVIDGGPVSTGKGINLPDSDLPFAISAKDLDDVAFAVRLGADFLAASYVGEAGHVEAVRAASAAAGGCLPVVAKLERATAIEHLDEIVAASDGVMVARGDLGVEVPLATVPVLQKKILAAGRRAGKPVIVATQM